MKETKNKHVLELPREVLKASGLANGQELGALSLDGVVLLTRDSMPIVDLLQMLDTLHRYAAAMLTQIAVECGPCEKADESLTADDVLEECGVTIPSWVREQAGIPENAKLASKLETLRAEMHRSVDARVDRSIQRILTGSVLEESPTLPLHTDPSVFKGKKPEAVLFPNGQSVRTPTWKAAVLAIMQDCNADPAMHTYLMGLRGKVMGRQRTILAASPEKMHAPLEIDKELYMESYYDTASLLYVLKNRVLDEVGYNYSGIRVQLRQEQEEAQKQSLRMDEMTL